MLSSLSILLSGLAVTFGCATRSVPAVASVDAATNPQATTASLRQPVALDGESDGSDAPADDDHSKHDHSKHDHSKHDHSKHDHSKHDHSDHQRVGDATSSAQSNMHDHAGMAQRDPSEKARYVCPMHPEVSSSEPGKCPECGMNLEKAQ